MSPRLKRNSLRRIQDLARALADLLAEERSTGHSAALFDAAIQWMVERNLAREITMLPRLFTQAEQEREGTVSATVATPTGTLGEMKGEVAAALEKAMGKPVALEELASRALLGGAIVRMRDERLDGSLHSALERLRMQLSAPSVTAF